jgi:limonene-1,2-epoxide hydrolase
MNLNRTILNNASGEATAAERVLQVALAALKRGDFLGVVEQLSREFTFSDYALELEFTDKQELITFFSRTCERFPNTERTDTVILSSADHVVSQWTLTGTEAQPFFLGGRTMHLPIHARGVSIAQIENGKICQWAEYYDQIQSRRYCVAGMFTDWEADCC